MEITYIGHSCFKIKGKDITVVVDPYDPASTGYKLPKLSADIVLISHMHNDHAYSQGIDDVKMTVNTAGEYEMGGTFVYGIQTFHDEHKGEDRGANIIYQIDIDGFSLLHLGDLGHELSKETLERITSVDVLMIPVGGHYTIDAQTASKVISSIEPSIIIPMHYQTPDLKNIQLDDLKVFMEEMGASENGISKSDKLKLSSKSDVPEESIVNVLNPQH